MGEHPVSTVAFVVLGRKREQLTAGAAAYAGAATYAGAAGRRRYLEGGQEPTLTWK